MQRRKLSLCCCCFSCFCQKLLTFLQEVAQVTSLFFLIFCYFYLVCFHSLNVGAMLMGHRIWLWMIDGEITNPTVSNMLWWKHFSPTSTQVNFDVLYPSLVYTSGLWLHVKDQTFWVNPKHLSQGLHCEPVLLKMETLKFPKYVNPFRSNETCLICPWCVIYQMEHCFSVYHFLIHDHVWVSFKEC